MSQSQRALVLVSPTERHVAVFVTNGEIDEEARLLFERAAKPCGSPGCMATSYELWTRGKLLDMLRPVSRVWPVSLEGTRLILNLLAEDGRELPSPENISRIMLSLLPGEPATSPAKTAALTSMLVMAEIIKARWYETNNHRALYSVTVLVSIAGMRLADNKQRYALLAGYANLALEHCADLLAEARALNFSPRHVWSDRETLSEYDVMWERRRLVADCAAIALLGDVDLPSELRLFASDLVSTVTRHVMLWGQAQIPSLIVAFWARSRAEAGIAREFDLAATLRAIQRANVDDNGPTALPQPYYEWPDVWALYHDLPHMTESTIFDDNAQGHLFFARAIMFMLAKRNMKRTCREVWFQFTRLIHEEVRLPEECFFTAVLSEEGSVHQIQIRTGLWEELVNESIDVVEEASFLGYFSSFAWLIAAYISLVPYRAWTPVLLWLDAKLDCSWYSESARPRSIEPTPDSR